MSNADDRCARRHPREERQAQMTEPTAEQVDAEVDLAWSVIHRPRTDTGPWTALRSVATALARVRIEALDGLDGEMQSHATALHWDPVATKWIDWCRHVISTQRRRT